MGYGYGWLVFVRAAGYKTCLYKHKSTPGIEFEYTD